MESGRIQIYTVDVSGLSLVLSYCCELLIKQGAWSIQP